jgi:hypothetical protein
MSAQLAMFPVHTPVPGNITNEPSYVTANTFLLSTLTRLTWTHQSNLELDILETIFGQYGGRRAQAGC